ncbi:isochorismatase family protein [Pseudoalteromonas luteoviolacea]|uniref:Isochorismatase-like domain-containing protein n=1 Tax=Pseudoalteromonas luteoviolacea NCIMB 1942 TaxID=1365253 RepID=A0A167CTM2_9GAMM|nr:isochorismatase family protein [Pseudoalteromonas luteoviolacea]KZN48048.1 hypothetical protein N482_08610 [Pseudoalteromonas luteoviolacea NCIMB 1942]KZX01353.1 hypothetical protein JL49_06470 [Pseudoalteromonas luteoviolacea]
MDERTVQYQILVVDIQKNFQKHIDEYENVIEVTHKLLTAAQLLDIPTLVFEQYPKGLGHTDERLTSFPSNVIEKTTFSAFKTSNLAVKDDCKPPSIKVIVGLETHICVYQTAQDLLKQGHTVYILADGVCSRNLQHKNWALEQLRYDGAKVICLEAFLFEALADAKHPQFKQVSKLIQ